MGGSGAEIVPQREALQAAEALAGLTVVSAQAV